MPPTLDASNIQLRTTQLSDALSKDDALDVYYRLARLPPARFANRRLQLPCIVFHVKLITVKDQDNDGNRYNAKVSGLGMVEFKTADNIPPAEPRRLVFVHPWISQIRGPHPHGGVGIDVSDSEPEVGEDAGTDEESGAAPPLGVLATPLDHRTLALQMIVRVRQRFNALLLLRQPGGEYKRVAAENEIVVQISRSQVRSKDIHAEVLDIL
ncbi:hypothetical protein EV363DRAFT_1168658 [Boletus edulis]|nr:hypothetical protein EV363DRAFT_1168658 [Boletus edulis]